MEDDSGLELSVCPEGVLTIVFSAAVLVLCLLIAAGVLTAVSSAAALVLCSLTAAGVMTAASSSAASVAGSSTAAGVLTAASSAAASVAGLLTLEDVPIFISILALDSLIVADFLIVLSVDLDFCFLLQKLIKSFRLSNYRF